MLILIGITPAYFALDSRVDPLTMKEDLIHIQQTVAKIDTMALSAEGRYDLQVAKSEATALSSLLEKPLIDNQFPKEERLKALL